MEQGESGNELLQGLDSGAQKCVLNVKLYYLLHIFKSNSFQCPLDKPGNEAKHKTYLLPSGYLMACSKYRTFKILL